METAFTPPALDAEEKPGAEFSPPPISAEEFTPPPVTTAEAGDSPEAVLKASAKELPPFDVSQIKLTPYDQFVFESAKLGTSNPQELGNADFLTAVGKDPIGFLKSLPGTAGRLMAAPGSVAYYQAADAVSKLFGDPHYGGNLKAMEQGDDVLPADLFVAQAAKTNPHLAVTAKLGKAATEVAPSMGLAAAPAAVNRILAAGFSAQMIAHAPQLFEEYANESEKPKEDQDAGKLAELKSQMVQTFLFAPMAAAGATHGLDTAAIDRFVPRGAGVAGSRFTPPPVQTPEPDPAVRNAAMEAAAQMPERPETIGAQLDWLTTGKRKAVLLTSGAEMPALPAGAEIHPTDAGTFIFDPDRTSPAELDRAVAENKIGDVLDYGIADKPAPDQALGAVTIRGADGIEKQAVVTDRANLKSVLAKAKAIAGPEDTVQIETPEQVIRGRQANPTAAPSELPAVRMAREQREAMAQLRAQTDILPPPTDQADVTNAQPGANGIVNVAAQNPEIAKTPLKEVEITKADYNAARQGNNPFMEVGTATGLAKDIKRAQEFGQDALTARAGETEPKPVNQLYVGDQFKIKGQPVHVAEWVTDADTGAPAGVYVDGAYDRQFVPVDQTVHIDAGTLTDAVQGWFDRAIAATSHDGTMVMEGVSSAPYWMTKTAINAALKLARFTYTQTRDLSRSVGEAVRFLKAQRLDGFNESEAMDWLESNLRGDPVAQDTGRAIGAATEERRPLQNTSAAQQMTGSNTTTLPFLEDLQAAVTGAGWRQRVGGWLGGAAGETFPVSTRLLRVLGEQGARWIASRAASLPLADAFSEDVTRGLTLDDVEFGAALHEDNLRSVQQSQLDAATKLEAAGELDTAAKLRARAQKVFTFVGQGGVFPDEETYQAYLQKPTTQAAVRRHIATWNRIVDPMYREAMKLDPQMQLPARGLQTGARINLNFVKEGETAGPNVFVGSAAPKGVLANVLQRRSPFGRMAKGTAEAYRPSYQEAMRNTYTRQLEISNRNKFDRMMVEAGHAIIDRPGRQNELKIGGEGVTPFEIKRMVLQLDGQRIPRFENIYVRNSIAPEYRSALNLDPKFSVPVVTPMAKLINGLALSGLTEVTAHIGNLSHALFWRPGVTQNFWGEIGLSALGRVDVPVAIIKALRKFTAEDKTRIRELTEISAMREPPPPKSGFNLTKWGGAVIEHMDTRTRLQLDRMYQNLAEQDLVPKTETARREFVNQVGQYNRRAQGQVMHWLRDTGIAPFVTAGRAFNVLALRTALLNPGIESTGAASRLALGATMAAKVGGTLTLIATLNYLLTHKKGGGVFGRPGVALGAVDLGVDDKNKRPLTLNLANILGLQRVARVTGIRGGAEALRYHLPLGTVLDSTYRDLQNSWTAPVLGPLARTVSLAATGRQPAIGVPRTAKVVPPGQSQTLENLKTAAIETSPIAAGIHDSVQPGATGWEWLQKQGGRFTLQPGKPPQMVEGDRYKRIVARAQASDFVNDVIMRARKMQGVDRANYVRESIMQLDPADRQSALRTLEDRRIIPPGVVPKR
jgi:hypothetical protein